MTRIFILALAAMTILAGEPLPVVTGNTVVHDLTIRVGGDRVAATCLLKPGIDSHAYEPVPEDVRRLAGAKLVVINGLGFEGWFEKLATEAKFAGTVVVATTGITPLKMDGDHDHGHDAGTKADHDHDVSDPHAWNSVRQGVRYVENIRDALITADPAGAEGFRTRAAELIRELREADAWATAQLAAIPKAQRTLVTSHDALAYFAADYGFAVQAPNTALEDSQPTAKEVAEIVSFIKAKGVKGVFLESGKNPKLIEQIAREAGVKVGGELRLDGIGEPGTPRGTYLGTFKANVQAIVDALR